MTMVHWYVDGVSVAFVSAVLNGSKEPSEKICELVGVRKVISYERTKRV